MRESWKTLLYFTAVAGRTRRNGFKLQQGEFRLDIGKHFVIAGLLEGLQETGWAGGAALSVAGAYDHLGQAPSAATPTWLEGGSLQAKVTLQLGGS